MVNREFVGLKTELRPVITECNILLRYEKDFPDTWTHRRRFVSMAAAAGPGLDLQEHDGSNPTHEPDCWRCKRREPEPSQLFTPVDDWRVEL